MPFFTSKRAPSLKKKNRNDKDTMSRVGRFFQRLFCFTVSDGDSEEVESIPEVDKTRPQNHNHKDKTYHVGRFLQCLFCFTLSDGDSEEVDIEP